MPGVKPTLTLILILPSAQLTSERLALGLPLSLSLTLTLTQGGAERVSYRVAGLSRTCSQKIHNMVWRLGIGLGIGLGACSQKIHNLVCRPPRATQGQTSALTLTLIPTRAANPDPNPNPNPSQVEAAKCASVRSKYIPRRQLTLTRSFTPTLSLSRY